METVDDQAGGEADDAESRLPELTEGQALTAATLTPEGHSTNPPSRFTEPSLIKTLEDLGIGRPSTYASIIKTIQDRGYVWKKGQALVPSWIAFAVIGLLEHHFGRLVDYDFTAAMEDELDSIAAGNQGRTDWLVGLLLRRRPGQRGLDRPGRRAEEAGRRQPRGDRRPGDQLGPGVRRHRGPGRPLRAVPGAGPRRGQSQRANLPDDLPPDELTPEVAEQLFSVPQEGRSLGVDPVTGHEIVAKEGRYGPYVTELLPDAGAARGQTERDGEEEGRRPSRSRAPDRCSRA